MACRGTALLYFYSSPLSTNVTNAWIYTSTEPIRLYLDGERVGGSFILFYDVNLAGLLVVCKQVVMATSQTCAERQLDI
jgi:hypothetical protein